MFMTDLNVMFTTCTLGSLICDDSLSKHQSDSFPCVAFHKSFDCFISIILGLYWALMQKKKKKGFVSILILNNISYFLPLFCVVAKKKFSQICLSLYLKYTLIFKCHSY